MHKALLFLITLLLATSCDTDSPLESTPKNHQNDPFISSIVESQFFEIDNGQVNTVECADGTVIVIPKDCFIDISGEPVEGKVKIEVAEALELEDMILSNLTTTSNNAPLESGGMVYFNASKDSEQLGISQSNPVYFEIPTHHKKAAMLAFEGERTATGEMNWTNPKPLENYLIPLDLNELNFLPTGFEKYVQNNLPFKSHLTATKTLCDSLYYSFAAQNHEEAIFENSSDYNLNEPYYNDNSQVIDGNYTSDSYVQSSPQLEIETADSSLIEESLNYLDPAKIKAIRQSEFQNTLISTREFENRLKIIHWSCREDILDIYVNNLDLNLWEIDSLALQALGENEFRRHFDTFYDQRLTKLERENSNALELARFYHTKTKEIRNEIEGIQRNALNQIQEEKKLSRDLIAEYKTVLWKREKHRMQKYGFTWTRTGWINIDKGIIPKERKSQRLEVIVSNSSEMERAYTYAVYPAVTSIFRLNTDDNSTFFLGNSQSREMQVPTKGDNVIIAIGYNEDQMFMVQTRFDPSVSLLELTLKTSSEDQLQKALRRYKDFTSENNVLVDLMYMEKLHKVQKQERKLQDERNFIYKLEHFLIQSCGSRDDRAASILP